MFFFCLFWVTPEAYGSSQAHVCNLYHSLRQCRILNPLSQARDPTHILMDTSRFITAELQRELQGAQT